jgi:hypothetical protein
LGKKKGLGTIRQKESERMAFMDRVALLTEIGNKDYLVI